jgi:hypothetical protein
MMVELAPFPSPRYFRLNPVLERWPIVQMDGVYAWGWVRGNREPHPMPLWIEVTGHALPVVSRDGQDAQSLPTGGERAVRGDDHQSLSTATARSLRELRRVGL